MKDYMLNLVKDTYLGLPSYKWIQKISQTLAASTFVDYNFEVWAAPGINQKWNKIFCSFTFDANGP